MRHALFPAALLSLLFLLALGLTLVNLQQALPLAQWSQALWSTSCGAPAR